MPIKKKKSASSSGKLAKAKVAVKAVRKKKAPIETATDKTPKKKKKGTSDSEKLAEVIVKGMQEKKASDIVVMDLREVKNAITDFFVLCSGNSDKQLSAIADGIDEFVQKELNENPWHSEGKNNKEWMLLDYINVVAHIFRKDRREFFALEQLWGDAKITEIVTE